MNLHVGVKTDPILYRYSYKWLFRLMQEEGVKYAQLGTFFEMYQLPNDFFRDLRRCAEDHDVRIASIFTAHRELGGFFRDDGPGWVDVARQNFERAITIGALLGADSVGSNPGAVLRDRMGTKPAGVATYMRNMKELLHIAADQGVSWLGIEPMSCLAEPPTLPAEQRAMAEELDAYHAAHRNDTARAGYCADVAHGYADVSRRIVHDAQSLLAASLPWTHELHLKNTDAIFGATFGFSEVERKRGIIDIGAIREFLRANAGTLPVTKLIGYLEIGGPKLGRDYSDGELDDMLRDSLRHLRQNFETVADTATPSAPSVPQPGPVHLSSLEGVPAQVIVAPSMMCADACNLERDLRRLEGIGADWLHFDVMDAHFVPNMPLGLGMIEALRPLTALPFDAHLMVDNPDFFVRELSRIGAQHISVHAEACQHLDRTLNLIRDLGMRAGVAINPATPLSVLDYVWESIDYVMLMTVNPGFAGQKLVGHALRKIADCRALRDRHAPTVRIAVDGNVSFANIPGMVAAGADVLVAGTSSLFSRTGTLAGNMLQTREAIANGIRQRPAPKPGAAHSV